MQRFDNYSSHLNVFEKLFSSFEISTVLEFGLGSYSTPFFASHAEHVTSVEQESREWFDKMAREISAQNWHSIYEPDPKQIFTTARHEGKCFDLVFSDGKADTRCQVANLAMAMGAPFVVLHDAEKVWYYRWNLLDIPGHYSRFNYCHRAGARKITSLLVAKGASLIDSWTIPEHDRVVLCYSSPQQPMFQMPYKGDKQHQSQKTTTMVSA